MTISQLGSVTAASTSLTPTTGLAGDLMIASASRSTAATVPTLASGWFTISSVSGNTTAELVAGKWCTGTNDASGTWTGATQLIITKYRGVLGIGAIGTPSNATGTSISYPALTLIQSAGRSWLLGTASHRTASNVSTAPTGMTNVSSVGTGPQAAQHDTNGGVTSWSAQSVTVNASSGHNSFTLELLADASTFNPIGKFADIGLTNGNKTATRSDTTFADSSAIVTLPRGGDKRVFSVTIGQVTSNGPSPGLTLGSLSTSTYVGNSGVPGFAWWLNNTITMNGSTIGSAASYTTGDTLYIAVDDANQLFWGRVNSGNWNGSGTANPDTGAGGISYAGIGAGQIYPCVSFVENTSSATFDGTATASLTTFKAWDDNTSGISGSASITLGAATLASTSALEIQAAASPTLGALTLSATGDISIKGVASPTLGGLTLASTGALSIKGALTSTLGGVTLSATGFGSTGISGSANITLGSLGLVGTGTLPVKAAAGIGLAPVGLSSAGALTVSGTAAITLGGISLSATGVGSTGREGSLSVMLGALTLTSRAQLILRWTEIGPQPLNWTEPGDTGLSWTELPDLPPTWQRL